ncbi:Uncharacterised protein [Helicobacter mustelae]|nr:Uncharacterised protein [Helicobacter mustelae]
MYYANKMIDAKLKPFVIEDSKFLHSMIQNQLAQKFKNGDRELECFHIDRTFEAINSKNQKTKNLFLLGLPTEGIKFYTFILPRPHIQSTFLRDANTAVNAFFKNIGMTG